MSNVLSEQAKQQVIALGRLGWSLRRIEQETGVRRETASVYLKAAGIAVGPRGRPRRQVASAKPAISVATDLAAKPAISVATDSGPPKTAMGPSASICEPFREAIELGLRQGRNAMGIWQLCRSRNSCQNAEFGPMPSGRHQSRMLARQTPIAAGCSAKSAQVAVMFHSA